MHQKDISIKLKNNYCRKMIGTLERNITLILHLMKVCKETVKILTIIGLCCMLTLNCISLEENVKNYLIKIKNCKKQNTSLVKWDSQEIKKSMLINKSIRSKYIYWIVKLNK